MAFPVQPLQGLKITVPTAVLVDGEQPLLLLRDGDEFGGLSVRRSKGLVDNDVATCEETLFGLLEVRCIRSSDDDQADRADGQQFVETAYDRCLWVRLHRFVAATLHDCSKAQAFYR